MIKVHLHRAKLKVKSRFSIDCLSLLNVNIKLNSLLTHPEEMLLSLLYKDKRTLEIRTNYEFAIAEAT